MKVVHVISSIDKNTGGPARSVTGLIRGLLNLNLKIDLLTLNSMSPIMQDFLHKSGEIHLMSSLFNLLKKLNQPGQVSIYHGHGMWQLPVALMSMKAIKNHKPFILTTRGMLEPWALTQSKLKKRIALFVFQNKHLRNANCLHATAQSEAKNLRKLGFKNPIAIIPNGINLEEYPKPKSFEKGYRKILFLSRIHPKKGIELLIEAWAQLDKDLRQNWKIEIVGNGELEYIVDLKDLIVKLKISDSVSILPPCYGEAKINKYLTADLFVLPTYSENFGIVVAEALACGVPVITTKGTPWEDLITYNCGDWIDTGVQSLVESLCKMMMLSPEELALMGENGRNLIEKKYDMLAVAKQMHQLYQWILNKSGKPKFVVES